MNPIDAALANAPLEDEEISEQERQEVAEARDWLRRNGKGTPHADAMRELGLE